MYDYNSFSTNICQYNCSVFFVLLNNLIALLGLVLAIGKNGMELFLRVEFSFSKCTYK